MSIMVIVFFTVLFQGVGCPVYFFLHLSQLQREDLFCNVDFQYLSCNEA